MFVPLTLAFLLDENMRSTGSTHRRTPITAWHRRPNTKGAIVKRIQTITKELGTLQAEMHGELAEPVRGKTNKFLEDSVTIETLNLFKAELDQLRRILWFYTEEATRKPSSASEPELQSRQPEKASSLLQAPPPKNSVGNAGRLKPADQDTTVEPISFFERLDNVIDAYMQEKKPASAETKTVVRRETKAFS